MAHPDDAELLCAGTLARAKADGAAVGICVMCTGDKGVAAGETGGADAASVRRGEADAAAKLIGAELLWFGCPDGELFDSPAPSISPPSSPSGCRFSTIAGRNG